MPSQDPNRYQTVFPGRRADEQTPEQHPTGYELEARDFVVELVPGWLTRQLGYGMAGGETVSPGPTFRTGLGEQMLVRAHNHIDPELHLEVSVHLHGGHTPAHSDGHPNFMIEPGEARDYYYPNSVPLHVKGRVVDDSAGGDTIVWQPERKDWDHSEAPSTMWYHDHAEDITAHNALMGLAGFYILTDEHEQALIDTGVLPKSDIPIALRDVCLCPVTNREHFDPKVLAEAQRRDANGTAIAGEARIHFDPFDHDGALGNVVLLNGRPFPKLTLERRRHRIRLLNASLARFYHIRFVAVGNADGNRGVIASDSDGRPQFLEVRRIGKDSWLMPEARSAHSTFLGMANRADIVLDLGEALAVTHRGSVWDPSTYDVYMISTLVQKDGRGPGHGDNENDQRVPRGGMNVDADGAANWEFTIPDADCDEHATPLVLPADPNIHMRGRPADGSPEWLWLMKIEMTGAAVPTADDATLAGELRPHKKILPTLKALRPDGKIPWKAIPRRVFDFERRQGAWQINHEFYDGNRANAVPALWSTELWVLRNKSGGWWHPIHIHLESHQQVFAAARNPKGDRIVVRDPDYDPDWLSDDGGAPTLPAGFDPTVWNTDIKHDTSVLAPNTEVHLLMRFRTFQGPFVFHCHNLNHEDMRMMFQFDPRLRANDQVRDRAQSSIPVRPDFWFFTERAHGGAE